MRDYLDFQLEILEISESAWAVHASCPSGETPGATLVEADLRKLDDLVGALDSRALSETTCFELGTVLGGLLLPGEVLELFREVFHARDEGQRIRFRLVLRGTRIAGLPWEYSHVPLEPVGDHPTRLALHPDISMIRHQALAVAPPERLGPVRAPLRVLAVSAHQLPDLPELSSSDGPGEQAVGSGTVLWDALPGVVTLPALDRALTTTYDLFHFSGHALLRSRLNGSDSVGLAIGDGRGGVHLLEPAALAQALMNAGVRVAVINACNPVGRTSEHRLSMVSQLVEAGVPAVLAMQIPVEDSHALVFSQALYRRLGEGDSLEAAVSAGRLAMRDHGVLLDWGAPVLYCRAPDSVLIDLDEGASNVTNPGLHAHGGFSDEAAVDREAVWRTLARLCERWRPTDIRDEQSEIRGIMPSIETDRESGKAVALELMRLLGEAYPEVVRESELMESLGLRRRGELTAVMREANQRLNEINPRLLSKFSVEIKEGDSRGYRLRRRPVSDLIERSPEAHKGIDYRLRLGFGLYDVGHYMQAVTRLVECWEQVEDGRRGNGRFSVPETGLLFYYLSKALLKLNRYAELLDFLEGPYQRFSQSLLTDLEVQRLHVAGVRYRQLGDLGSAQTCFEAAISLLRDMLGTDKDPALNCGLGDSHVLLAQCRLEQAVSPKKQEMVRTAALRSARECIAEASIQFSLMRSVTGAGTHYEGRLNGTTAFLTVVESLVSPQTVDTEAWEKAIDYARGGFTPERDRKPFGIVAGKFALSIVLLANARWYCLVEEDERSAMGCLKESKELMDSLEADYLGPDQVFLGASFEKKKMESVSSTIEMLLDRGSLDGDVWREIESNEFIWSPLV